MLSPNCLSPNFVGLCRHHVHRAASAFLSAANNNIHITVKSRQETYKTCNGVLAEVPPEHPRNFRLSDTH